ncbi:MAG: hypothetical protein R2733_05545 [Acidimicrobiales bacterium]
MVDARAVMTARNNADWYATLFAAHGCRFDRFDDAFVAVDPPPPFHSWVTITAPELGVETQQRLAEMAKQVDFVVKDSFCTLDLDELRLQPFIEASWIYCEAPSETDLAAWHRVRSAADLEEWEAAWSDGSISPARQFPDALLGRPEIACWGRRRDGVIDGGAIANRSLDCTGLSNVFGDAAVMAAARLCWEFGDGLPVVGYEWSDALDEATAAGFAAVGALRICARR